VEFLSVLDNYTDYYSMGAGPLPATDGLEQVADIIDPPAHPGKYITMVTRIDGQLLLEDNRANLEPFETKTWDILLIVGDSSYQGLTGMAGLTWDISDADFVDLQFIDYGMDATRTNKVNEFSLRDTSSYSFPVVNGMGVYRYITIEATGRESAIPEFTLLGGIVAIAGALGCLLVFRKKRE
jgi:hypothetical protein